MKLAGIIYVTIRRKERGGWGGDSFVVTRATTVRHTPGPGEVELPIKIMIDDAWFSPRPPLAKIEIGDPPPIDIEGRAAR